MQAHGERGEILVAVARGIGRLAGAEEVGGDAQEFALDGQFGAGGGVGAGGVGQVEQREVEHEVGRRPLDPAGGSGAGGEDGGEGERAQSGFYVERKILGVSFT